MENKKKFHISYGAPLFDVKTGKDYDFSITSIHVDNEHQVMNFVFEKGKEISQVKLTIQALQECGVINLDNLNNFFKGSSPFKNIPKK